MISGPDFQPMLAETAPDMKGLKFPFFVSPKLDGVRCVIRDGVAVSRKLKPIPNAHVQKLLSGLPEGLDGELIVGEATDPNVFTTTQSAVMRRAGEPQFSFHVFDIVDSRPFAERHAEIPERIAYSEAFRRADKPNLMLVAQEVVSTADALAEIEARRVEQGYEGVMLRRPDSPYKFGRSTVREAYLLKMKRFQDAEAIVIGVQELMRNGNEATRDALGYAERSTHRDGLVSGNTLGALVCKFADQEFGIGTGFTAARRDELWRDRDALLGRFAKFKYQGLGSDGRPRFPVFQGFRSELDM